MPDKKSPLNVLVVDDSAVVRESMTAVLSRGRGIQVIVAADPLIAMRKMAKVRPDVIVLDLEMPRMHGLDFLRKIMTEDPIPVVVCSGLTARGTEAALRALEEGAVDIVVKPEIGVRDFLHDSAAMLIETVRAAAHARLRSSAPSRSAAPAQSAQAAFVSSRPTPYPPPPPSQWSGPLTQSAARPVTAPSGAYQRSVTPTPGTLARVGPLGGVAMPPKATNAAAFVNGLTSYRVVVIGASTGGTEAIREVLEVLSPDTPGIVIAQHMPPVFTAAFAARLNQVCRIDVKEAAHGDLVLAGRALIAPGNKHMRLRGSAPNYHVTLDEGPLVSGHRPSVDVLFESVAAAAGRNALGIILTGMGADGAAGMLAMKRSGAVNIAQNEKSCVVFGMPKEAIAAGAVDEVLPLAQIAAALARRLSTRP